MARLAIGVRVRFIGQPHPFQNTVNLLLVGRTGVIRNASSLPGYDWFVEMDEGCYDIDADSRSLVPIGDDEADASEHAEVAEATNA
jgi:hypothetical protein